MDAISDILDSLKELTKAKGTIVQFNDPSYTPIPISPKNFHKIRESAGKKTAFIDGGNAEILKSPSFSLQLLRVCSVIFQDNKKVSSRIKECFVLTKAKDIEGKIFYETSFFQEAREKINFDSFDGTIRQGNHRISISSIAGVIRRLLELDLAAETIINLEKGDAIVLDGDLKASITGEKEYLNILLAKAKEKGVIVSALSKTSDLFTEAGSSLIPLIESLAPKKEAWFYFPLVDIDSDIHKADIYVTKLNRNAKHIFKCEVAQGSDANIFSSLANNSKESVFLGYPYGLIEADRLARVTNREKEYYQTILLHKLKGSIDSFLNISSAHSILDSIS